ncbi:MAG: glutathione S-transferase family protein [Verrucomicrobiales bacterium]
MFELIQIPYSPYCIVQRRILESSGAPFKLINIPNGERELIWKLTKGRYYQVPVLKDGKTILFETGDNTQIIAKYLDAKLKLELFPKQLEGLQDLLWQYFENEVEGIGFKLNDIYYEENIKPSEHLLFIRHKERKFGRGCLEQWKKQQSALVKEFEQKLLPCEEMLFTRPFLLDDVPRFIDFNLFGMIGNALYSGHYKLPKRYGRLQDWYNRMSVIKLSATRREKLHS